MSRIIDQVPPFRSMGGGPPRYPWAEWTDGQAREISRGDDFEIDARNMATIIRQYAQRRGLDAAVRVRGDSVLFQFTRPEEAR